MTNTEMLAKLRAFLDEATADYYVDATDLYGALTDAQLEIATVISANWKQRQLLSDKPVKTPKTLYGIRAIELGSISSGNQTVAIAGDPLQVLSVIWQFDGVIVTESPYAIEMAEGGETKRIWFSSLTKDGTYFYYNPNLLTVHPISTDNSAGYTLVFFDAPVDISSSVQPELDAVSHDAIVERACWILLKDRESEQAKIHLEMYSALLQGLMV